MPRIVILCEGPTEEIAIRYFVTPQWYRDGLRQVALKPINLRAKIEDVGPLATRFLHDTEVLGVFTLIDLYGVQDRVRFRPNDSLDEKARRVHEWLAGLFHHERKTTAFFPHLAVHETEAWLLAEGEALRKRLGNRGIKPDRHAESKDFGTPPKVRINDLFRQKRGSGYRETLDGKPLFSALRFDPVYQTCRHFRAFYDGLKRVVLPLSLIEKG